MGDAIDPSNASIDGLIRWLREQRLGAPHAKLADLLADHQLEPSQLLDLACIDLMQRRRMGHAISVEHYVDEFPCIGSRSNLLDLIDAELCVAAELGQTPDIDRLFARFPSLTAEIRELMQLGAMTPAPFKSALADVDHIVPSQPAAGPGECDFSVDLAPRLPAGHRGESLTEYPVEMPEWFIAEKCVTSGPGHWLIRGRDSTRGIALALKVLELPAPLTSEQSKQLLDACEMASKVRNRCWVSPNMAAIQHRHLGVIRPWLFANRWHTVAPQQEVRIQLRNLATVAFALQAAHQAGAAHGGVHSENLLVDHHGKVQIVDGTASRRGMGHWLTRTADQSNVASIASPQDRRQLDTHDLIELIAAASTRWDGAWAIDLPPQLRQVALDHCDEACGAIGETLIRRSDQIHPTARVASLPRRTWRYRLAQWLNRQA